LVSIATTAEQRAIADSVRAWAQRAHPIDTVRALENDPAAWRGTWSGVVDLGVFDVVGAGGSLTDLSCFVEQLATVLAPGPVLGTAVAAAVLTSAPDEPVALACAPDGPALAAGADAALLAPDVDGTWRYYASGSAEFTDVAGADLSRPLADLHVDGTGDEVGAAGDIVLTLAAAEAAGVAQWCLDTAVEYAKVREQFGAPIGSFQAIKHLCAEMLCRTESAGAVAWDAAEATPAERPLAAAVAASVALDAAVTTAQDCIQVLGGIGFTWEHDAHLYLRRALALRAFVDGTARWRRRVAELTGAGARRTLRIDLGEHEASRPRVRAQVESIAAVPAERQRVALADAGLLAPHWPAPHGLDAGPAEQVLIDQELARADVTRPDLVIAAWAVPTIIAHGTAEQIDRFAAPTLRGELTWCQLFSEPGAGSDLASLRTRAVRVDGGWALSGQKVWTSLAHRADWAICLARTNPDVPKHKGITYFLVDMRSAGIDIRPLREITGEAMFNEVFLDDVVVPDELVVGEVDGGWPLARTTLANERVAMGNGSSLGDDVERLLAEIGTAADLGAQDELGAVVAEGLACSLLDLRATIQQLDGRDPGAASSVRKLVGVRHRQHVAEFGLSLLGGQGTMASDELQNYLLSRCLTIAGGTTQVLLTVAAERILGLPRK
jgi:alkylation response protein AidB-like acyl-CoA dehydrogenase